MRRWHLILVVGLLGLTAMGLYVPFVKVERVYAVVPVHHAGSPIVSMGRTDELREVRVESAGYGWVWAPPQVTPWFGSEVEVVRVDWLRLGQQAAVWCLLTLALLAASVRPKYGRRSVSPAEPGAAPDPAGM